MTFIIIHNSVSEFTTVNDSFALFETTIANLGAASVQQILIPLANNNDLIFICENSILGN